VRSLIRGRMILWPIRGQISPQRFPPASGRGAGFGVINNKLYIAGGRDAANLVINLTWEWNRWLGPIRPRPTSPLVPEQRSWERCCFGLLWVFGGGNPSVS